MKNHELSLIGVLILCLVPFSPLIAQETLPEIIKRVEPSTVLILTYDQKGNLSGQGSGFFISQDGDIITNRHVLLNAAQAEVKTTDGKVYPIGQIIAEDKDGDIIQVSVNIPHKNVKPLLVSSSLPETGERIIVIGNPLGLERTVSDGIVSAVRDIPNFGKIIQITAPISPGSSGSPVVNMKGEVIGVATLQIIKGQNLNFAIPSERITRLKKLDRGKTLTERRSQISGEWLTSAEGLFFAGLSYLWREEYENALSHFEKAVEKDPNNADAFFYIGYCNGELGRYTEEIEAYKQAIRIKPDLAEAHYNLGLVYLQVGDKSSALKEYKILKELDEDLANELFNLIYR